MTYTLLLVTGDGCDACDADYPTYRDAIAALRDACVSVGPDAWFSEPVDGHGIIYTITMCTRTGKPELWTEYRYRISEAEPCELDCELDCCEAAGEAGEDE
jgi:hypothetical protein